jgi:hypothetical protein
MTNEDKPAAPRRRLPLRLALLVLLGVLLAWRFWPRPAPVEDPPAPSGPSPLDVLDPAQLDDKSWPRDARPAEAVGVYELDRDAGGRLEVSIDWGVIFIKDVCGKEVVRIDDFAPPPNRQMLGWPRDDHKVLVAALSPKADRLVVLGHTTHRAGPNDHDAGFRWTGWAQVWRWEGDKLTPLEAQPLAGQVAAFSPDGKLLATGSGDCMDVWEVGDTELRHLGTLSGESKQLLFAPNSRALAVISPRSVRFGPPSVGVYDLGPLLQGGSGWTRGRLLCVVLGLVAAVAVYVPVSEPSEVTRAQRR